MDREKEAERKIMIRSGGWIDIKTGICYIYKKEKIKEKTDPDVAGSEKEV